MSDLANPLARRLGARLRRRAAALAVNAAIGLACAGVALASFWIAAAGGEVWADRALGWTAGGAFSAFALVQLMPLARALVRLDLE